MARGHVMGMVDPARDFRKAECPAGISAAGAAGESAEWGCAERACCTEKEIQE